MSVDFTMKPREYYQSNLAPVGYYYHFYSSTGGTFDSIHLTNTINIGLVASPIRGDAVDYALEAEPNNFPAAASAVVNTKLPVNLMGDFGFQQDIDVSITESYATNRYLYLNARPEVEPNNSLSGEEVITLNKSLTGNIDSSDNVEFRSISIPGFSTINWRDCIYIRAGHG